MKGLIVKTIIGCEIHIQLLTKTKAFCGCVNSYGGTPNTRVCPICLGLPGTLPNLNYELVRKGSQMAHVLGCSLINRCIEFDRKHYLYPDLTKGYQITQNDFPIGSEGKVTISLEESKDQVKTIRVKRVHMEEDTGKSLHLEGDTCSYIDYNRAGAPLLEVVSYPDMFSAEEAVQYLKTIHERVKYLGLSSGNMEEGAFRCDINVNLHITEGNQTYQTPISELKNINSFRMIKEAIIYEVHRQKEEFLKTRLTLSEVGKQTLGWDDKKGKTFLQREKEEAEDYRYLREPDIPLIQISESTLQQWLADIGELPDVARNRLKEQYGLSDFDVETLTNDLDLVAYFEKAAVGVKDSKRLANWILTEVMASLNKQGKKISDFLLPPDFIAELVNLLVEDKINGPMAKETFSLMVENQKRASDIVAEKGFQKITNTEVIENVVDKILSQNTQSISDYLAGKTASLKYLMGQVMRESKGKIDAKIAENYILNKIELLRNKE